jgi:hypothetical protein
MALEFALRPRFSLEQPAPRQRARRLRIPRLALPILAYWLAIAGATHVLLRVTADDSAEASATVTPARRATDESVEAQAPISAALADPETSAPLAATSPAANPAPEPDFEPEPAVAALPEPPPRIEPAPAPRVRLPAPNTRAEAPVAPLAVAPAPLPAVRAEPRAPVRPAPTPFEEPAPRSFEYPKAAVAEPPVRDEARAASLPSCESAAAAANESIDLRGARGAPDLPREAFAAVLDGGTYLSRCAIPARTAIGICAAVQDGKVVGVSVTTEPHSSAISSCVRRAVAGLRFPRSARLDVARTRFEAAR